MKVCTFSYPFHEKPLGGERRYELLERAMKEIEADIWVGAGWTFCPSMKKKYSTLFASRKSLSLVFGEFGNGGKRSGDLAFWMRDGGGWKVLGKQLAACAGDDFKGLEKAIRTRVVSWGNIRFGFIMCGELYALVGAEQVRWRSDAIGKVLSQCDVIINPSHTVLPDRGNLKPKRVYLSKASSRSNHRRYISSANWQGETGRAPTLHTLFVDGIEQKLDRAKTGEIEVRVADLEL